MIELEIDSIRVNLHNYQRVIVLREKDADRYLPIWIGPAEADAITLRLQDVTVERPLTHDLLSSMIDQLGGSVTSVAVIDMTDSIFYAQINIDHDGSSLELDSRPSDAIAIAVRQQVPIYVAEAVLSNHGVVMGADGDEGAEDAGDVPPAAVTPEELEKLSAFQDFISGLDLDDLGKAAQAEE
ncbi:MAG: bifunctional nuclease family protein [Dehalococcoidia bacterium]|nr:bifunctional nuclease family protein [Dehalococcoidia bacterium]